MPCTCVDSEPNASSGLGRIANNLAGNRPDLDEIARFNMNSTDIQRNHALLTVRHLGQLTFDTALSKYPALFSHSSNTLQI